MPNTLLTASVVARAALATLYENTVMLPLCARDYESEFVPGVGATVNVRKPAVFTAEEWNGTSINVQNATETSVPVVLDQHFDVSFAVTSIERTLKIVDFAEQFLNPALEAHAQGIDKAIIAAATAGFGGTSVGGDADPTEPWNDPKVLTDARTVLSENAVPLSDRYAVVGPRMAGEWTKSDWWGRFDQSGSTAALEEASMGPRKAGFTPYESQNITTNVGLAFHRSGLAFVSRPLALPTGAADKAIMSYKGVGLRVVFDYDMQKKQDICSIDVLYGIKVMDAARGLIIDGSASS